MEHFINIIDVLAWPVTLLIVIWLARDPLKRLLLLVENVRYKEFEVRFRKQLEQVKEDVEEEQPVSEKVITNNSEINKLIDIHNNKLGNKKASLAEIKIRFWNLMRWNYEQTLTAFKKTEERLKGIRKKLNDDIKINASQMSLLT